MLYRVATCCLTTRPPHLIYVAGKVGLEPDDPALNKRTLCQLSYFPVYLLVGMAGFEPAASCSQGTRPARLDHIPIGSGERNRIRLLNPKNEHQAKIYP